MSDLIEKIFKNLGFYFYTPKIDTLGGYVYYLFWFKKIKNKKKAKSIIITQLFDPNSFHYYKSSFNPPLNYKLSLYKDLTFLEKFLSIIFSIIIFLNSLILKFIFFRKGGRFFCTTLGYTNRLKDNLSYFDIVSAKTLHEVHSDYNFLNLKKKHLHKDKIVFCVKDLNYRKYKKTKRCSEKY